MTVCAQAALPGQQSRSHPSTKQPVAPRQPFPQCRPQQPACQSRRRQHNEAGQLKPPLDCQAVCMQHMLCTRNSSAIVDACRQTHGMLCPVAASCQHVNCNGLPAKLSTVTMPQRRLRCDAIQADCWNTIQADWRIKTALTSQSHAHPVTAERSPVKRS